MQDQVLIYGSERRENSKFYKVKSQNLIKKPTNLDYYYGNTPFIYDYQVLQKLLEHSKLLSRLRPEVRQQFLSEQRRYPRLKKYAIARLKEVIWHQLNLFLNINHCQRYDDEPADNLTHQIFSWSLQDFLNRRTLKNIVWIDVLLLTPENCLQKYKFKKDVEQLTKYVEYIFDGTLSNMEDAKIDIDEHVVKPINNTKQVLQIYNNLEQELYENENHFKGMNQKDIVVKAIRHNAENRLSAIFMQTKIYNSHIWNPIENRYLLNCYQSQVNQNQYRMEQMQQKYKRDIEVLRNRTLLENVCTNNCMDSYYSSIDQIKTTILTIQSKFDEINDEMENKLAYKRIQIDKLREQRKWMSEQIERFHEEIEAMRIRQESEAAEMERLKLEEEELAAKISEKQKRKAKKGKKKGNIQAYSPLKLKKI